ncbi:MAG: DUF1015 domain-containing protein [Oscillospiraceae bacterium]
MEVTWENLGFGPADILLPHDCDLTKWSVVACDQYTAQPDYWERVANRVGEAPSTLKLILPESKLAGEGVPQAIETINETMKSYVKGNAFTEFATALIYVERKLHNGKIRHGLVGCVDLEQYDFHPGADSLIRATEGTVLERIPPRVAVREHAPMELPHVLLLTDDPEKTVIEPLAGETAEMCRLYDFDLMEHGGHITGWQLTEAQKARVCSALSALADPAAFEQKYDADGKPVLLFAVGDGNHSLATAKACYEQDKSNQLARYALVELTNLHDDSLVFEPIHRVLFGVEPQNVLEALLKAYPGAHLGGGEGHSVTFVSEKGEGVVTVPNPDQQLPVGTLQRFLDGYLQNHRGTLDYIHGDEVLRELGKKPGNLGFLLPPMGKNALFPTVIFDGVLPRKTFSMGDAHDKRFYLEARKIQPWNF